MFFDSAAGTFSTFLFPTDMNCMNCKIYMLTALYGILFLSIIQWLWVETRNTPLEKTVDLFGDGEDIALDLEEDEYGDAIEGLPIKEPVLVKKKSFVM